MPRPMTAFGRPRKPPRIGTPLQSRLAMREGTSGDVIKPRGGPRPSGRAVWSVIRAKLEGDKETRDASRVVPGRGVLRKLRLSAQKEEWLAASSESISEAKGACTYAKRP
eukprot:scaffold25381_cov40-Phaeocystis_antarctica.AAC.1